MRRTTVLGMITLVLVAASARASDFGDSPIVLSAPDPTAIGACVQAASRTYRLPPAVLAILLQVEGGVPGRVSGNRNGTVDIGPLQVNERWLPRLAGHWRAPIPATFAALRDSFCANVEGGAWILRAAIDEAHGDLWEGVALYHSHSSDQRAAYLAKVLRQAVRLRLTVASVSRGQEK